MGNVHRLGYKNHQAISSELVKFLAINAGFEAIKQAVLKFAALEADMTEVKKEEIGIGLLQSCYFSGQQGRRNQEAC